ncbi:hypothetical protein PGT21_027652 [Puccinia graminis f. sp. tritici]|uniref:Uncharacterized protein n=1 Tax=Puccinia graminis f. sp. tritici TaxID=56615 RepID=A0A5B0MEI0_PUCGR|nr:hypothetical protein PGT21_027652 [Puccinia graminis f. sp. tritici]
MKLAHYPPGPPRPYKPPQTPPNPSNPGSPRIPSPSQQIGGSKILCTKSLVCGGLYPHGRVPAVIYVHSTYIIYTYTPQPPAELLTAGRHQIRPSLTAGRHRTLNANLTYQPTSERSTQIA